MNLKKFLSGVLVGTFMFGVSAADISSASAASHTDKKTYEEYQKEKKLREQQRLEEKKKRLQKREDRKSEYEKRRKKDAENKKSEKKYRPPHEGDRYVKHSGLTGLTLELLAEPAKNISDTPQVKNGQKSPEPSKDKNGNVQTPPGGKNSPQVKVGQKTPESSKDKNGNVQTPPDNKDNKKK